jgi:hypothetical protein
MKRLPNTGSILLQGNSSTMGAPPKLKALNVPQRAINHRKIVNPMQQSISSNGPYENTMKK